MDGIGIMAIKICMYNNTRYICAIWEGYKYHIILRGFVKWGLTYIQIVSLGTLCYIKPIKLSLTCVTSNLAQGRKGRTLPIMSEKSLEGKKALRVGLGKLGPGPLERTPMLVS